MPKALIVEIFGSAKEFAAELDKAAGKTRQFSRAAGVAGVALAAGLAYGLEKSVEAAAKFQQSMELLHTQAGASTAEVQKMSKALVDMAGSVGTGPEELSQGLYHVESAGLRGAKALNALKIAAEGAKIGGANLEDVTNGLNAVIVSGIKGSHDFASAMGDLNATVGAGDMRMQDLSDALGTGLPAKAALFGISLKDVSAALAVFGDNNIRGAEAGTQLASAIRLMAAPSGAAADHLKSIGLSSVQLANDMRGSGGLVSAIQDLKDHMEKAGLSATEQGALLSRAFGGRQAGGIMLLIDQLDRFKTKEEEVGKGADSFGSAWQATTQTSAFATERFHATLQALSISLGASLLPAVTAVMAEFAKFAGFLVQHTTLAKALVIGLVSLAAALMTISVVSAIATAASSVLAVSLWATVLPIAAVVAAIALLGVGVYEIVKHWGTLRAATASAWDFVKGAVSAAAHAISGAIGSVIDDFRAVIGVLNDIIGVAEAAAHAIASVVGAASAKLPSGTHATKYGGVTLSGHRASGGPVSAGLSYLVGERGPEIFTPSVAGGITPNGGGGNVYQFSFPNYVGNQRDLTDMIQSTLLRLQRNNGTVGFA